jgi:hypothetical protein
VGWWGSWSGIVVAGLLSAQTGLFPLKDVRPGMKGVGKTVFSGARVEEFGFEVLGVLENVGPGQSVILARLSGGPLKQTGVLQGMSGSPVYIGGRLVGAVAMAFAFSKEPIAGIRPIQEMLRVRETAPEGAPQAAARLALDGSQPLAALFPPQEGLLAAGGKLVDIATPVSFGGFTARSLEQFAPQLRALGLEPRQGLAGGSQPDERLGDPASLQPGSMITVQLLSGDMSVGADGSVTHVEGNRIYAFGHRLLALGATDLPFARSEVLTLLPSLATSFKISAAREWLGAITQDRSTALAGELGRRAATIPVTISVLRQGRAEKAPLARQSYRMRMVNGRILSPFLLQLAVFSALDATEQGLGESTFAVSGEVEFDGGAAPLKLTNMYSGDFNVPLQTSLGTALPLAYAMQSGFEGLRPKKIALEIQSFDRKRQLQIEQVWASRREVRPGERLELTVVLSGENGLEVTRKVGYVIPAGAPTGPWQFTVADANTINLTEIRQLAAALPKTAPQLIALLNSLRPNTRAYLRVSRADPAYEVAGRTLPTPPPSAALILARGQASLGGALPVGSSTIAELEIAVPDMVVSGSRTIQVEVKE